jgi:hypothetical protein
VGLAGILRYPGHPAGSRSCVYRSRSPGPTEGCRDQ